MSSPSPEGKSHAGHHHSHDTQSSNAAVPWYRSPMRSWDKEQEVFSPRHEASSIELFFDLFFVANLATFTSYHAIFNRYNFWSYVAFFTILWTSWFHVVCFDARFSFDSVWERASKTVHFCTFAAFALVGYKFAPVAKNDQTATPHWIYRVLCWALFISRIWLALQYLFATISCSLREHRRLRLTLPLALNTCLFVIAAAVYAGLFGGFSDAKRELTGVILGLYATIVVELIGNLAISSIWRRLSYKGAHIGERLGLLGLIIIGEGVIGTTKTITRTMGKNGVYVEGVSLIFCIILILIFMWILYFDNLPKYKFGPIQQQFWMILHLPLHLSILGVVEGSQHVALARYLHSSSMRLGAYTWYGCVGGHLDGRALANNLTKNVQYFKINESARGTLALQSVYEQIYFLGNQTNICSPANTTDKNDGLKGVPMSFMDFLQATIGSIFQSFDLDIPPEDKSPGILIAMSTWKVVYTYVWSAIILLLVCYTISSMLATKPSASRTSLIRLVPIAARAAMIAFAIVMLVMGYAKDMFIPDYIQSAWMLPTIVLQLWVICWSDRFAKWWQTRRENKYDIVAPSEDDGDDVHMSPQRRQTNAYGYLL